jgi:hypothetical protein
MIPSKQVKHLYTMTNTIRLMGLDLVSIGVPPYRIAQSLSTLVSYFEKLDRKWSKRIS